MRRYEYHDIDEITRNTISGNPALRFSWENGLLERVNETLINNFFKCASWIEENCPNLNGEFKCRHNPYYWIKLVVENGKAYLEEGSHGYSFELALSTTETARMTTGSMQSTPYAFFGKFFFRNDCLEEFLSQWGSIKNMIAAKNNVQSRVFSEEFVP